MVSNVQASRAQSSRDAASASEAIAPVALMNTEQDLLADTMQAILRHPAFPTAYAEYLAGITTWRRSLGLGNRFVATDVAGHIMHYIVLLHFANRAGTPEEGATFTRAELGRLIELAKIGIDQIIVAQNDAVKELS